MNQTDNILQSEVGNSIFILTNNVHCIYSCQITEERNELTTVILSFHA